MGYTEKDMQLFEVMRKLDADTAELSDISGIGIFIGKRISIAQFSDAEGFFKVAMAIAADDNIYERIMRLAAAAYDIRNITHSDEDEDDN